MWFLLFIKQLPVIAIAEVKEIVPPKLRTAHPHADAHRHVRPPPGYTSLTRQGSSPDAGVIAAFRELDATVDAIEDLKKQKIADITVYTPTPRHEIEDAVDPPTSPSGSSR